MSQQIDVDWRRHLWTTLYWTDVQAEVWTGSSRNQTRLVDYRQGAWQEKLRGIHTSTSLLAHNAAVVELQRLDTLGITDQQKQYRGKNWNKLHLTTSKKLLSQIKMGTKIIMLYQRIWML